MREIIILIISLLLIAAAFFSLQLRKPLERKTMPEALEESFKQYCELLLASLKLKLKEVDMKQYRLLMEVPFEDGQFEYYSFEYQIMPEKAVADSNGIVLNSTELLEKGGLKGKPILLFFRREQETFEVSFLDDRDLMQKGYNGYVNHRYANIKNWPIDEEFALFVDGNVIKLWENLKGEPPFPFAIQTRERTHDLLSYTAQFTDTWEGQDIKVTTWIQFEKKRELIYWIKSLSPVAETKRGIHVGSTVEMLKEKYEGQLSYEEDFKGGGSCYGYMMEDNSCRYIAFFVRDGKVSEIWLTDGFDERPFKGPDKYVDNDVPWCKYDNTEKLSERYAREIYIGQHKSDFDVDKVFHSFLAKELHTANVKEEGVLEEIPGERTYYVVCQKKDGEQKLNVEVTLKRIKLPSSVTGDEIWIIDKYRSQLR